MLYDTIQSMRCGRVLISCGLAVPHNGAGAVLTVSERSDDQPSEREGGIATRMPTTRRHVWLPLSWSDSYAAALDAAWRLGAWDVLRVDYGPDDRSLSTLDLALDNAFLGRAYSTTIDGESIGGESLPSSEQRLARAVACERGWSSWTFKPTAGNDGAFWFGRQLRRDGTLGTDGGRSTTRRIDRRRHICAPQPGCARRVTYRLGAPCRQPAGATAR